MIRALAARYGVDPRAALAVASAEGLGGGVGDQGTSFGPFQLHVGGALPRGRGRAWAESPAGLSYAMQQIAGVAKGLQGPAAIRAIVTRFERPADPQGEIRRAVAALPQFGGASQIGGMAPAPSPTRAPGPLSPSSPAAPAPDLRMMIASQLASGRPLDFFALARAQRQQETPGPQAASAPSAPPAARPPSAVAPGGISPVVGKIIGLPYQGTHTLGNWESDRALDIAVPIGTPVVAPFNGFVGEQFGSLGKGGRFAGLRIHIVSPKNEYYAAHLSRFAPGIRPGVRVHAGQIIGYTGAASGVAHLHEALRYGNPRTLAAR